MDLDSFYRFLIIAIILGLTIIVGFVLPWVLMIRNAQAPDINKK
jgi:hypothetical protein